MVPSRLSIWRIALGVFVGNILCVLITLVLYACLFFGMMMFGVSADRLFR